MVKELVEDVKRWRADREINARSVLVYTPDSKAFVSKRWRDIKVCLLDCFTQQAAICFSCHQVIIE